jgi:hypothetical protein
MTNRWTLSRSLGVFGVLVVAMSSAGLAQGPAPGMGSWTLNVAKSKFSPGPAPKTATVTFSAAGDGVKAVIDTVSTTDAKVHWEYTAAFDGKPHPVTGNPDGTTRVVSADGKTMTVTSKGTNAQGQKVDNVQVYEKS